MTGSLAGEEVPMIVKTLQFVEIVPVAVSLVPGGAHLTELPNKIRLDREQYLTVQQIYRGWALSAIPLSAALLALAVPSRSQWPPFLFSVASFLLLLATLVAFFVWVFPVNQATDNRAAALESWQALRAQWEYTHAVNAVVAFAALVSAVLSALTWRA
jgi:hypothetical protein